MAQLYGLHRSDLEAMPLGDLRIYLAAVIEDPEDLADLWHQILDALGVLYPAV